MKPRNASNIPRIYFIINSISYINHIIIFSKNFRLSFFYFFSFQIRFVWSIDLKKKREKRENDLIKYQKVVKKILEDK